MVKDKHAKALHFIQNMKISDKCIGYDAREKNCYCLKQFLGDEISIRDSKNFFVIFLMIFGMALEKMMMKT